MCVGENACVTRNPMSRRHVGLERFLRKKHIHKPTSECGYKTSKIVRQASE